MGESPLQFTIAPCAQHSESAWAHRFPGAPRDFFPGLGSLGGSIVRNFGRRFEPVRFDDQEITGQVFQCALGGRANK